MFFLGHVSQTAEAYLRCFHALPIAESLDVYIDHQRWAKDFLYEDFSEYLPLACGNPHIPLSYHGIDEPFYERDFWISKHKIYTLILAPLPGSETPQGYLVNEPPKAIPEEHFLLRVANFSQFLEPSSLQLIEIKPYFKKVPLRQCGHYLAFQVATACVEWFSSNPLEPLLTSLPLSFKVTRYYTLYLIGGVPHYPLKCIQTIDGNAFLHFPKD